MTFEFAKGNAYHITKEHMIKLFQLFKVTNIADLREKLDSDIKPNLHSDYSEEKKRLTNLNLSLDVWKKLKDAGYTIPQAEQVISGDQKFELPENPFKKETVNDNFNENNFCKFCHHEHTETEPRICKETLCMCGMR